MELTCAIIVFTVGLVTASPYGYGTKGGALAKADASAVASGLPITAPSGAGYSGSYAKSSSSSFASSGASSSASSFSYSGTGAYPGSVPGATGCGTGACPSGGGYGPTSSGSQSYGNNNAGTIGTGSTGSGYNSDNANRGQLGNLDSSQKDTKCNSGSCQPAGYSNGLANSFSQANSVASTGAVYGSPSKGPISPGSGCTGGNCANRPGPDSKCISGQCDDDIKSSLNVDEKCTSGNCKVPQTEPLTPYRVKENNCASGNCDSTRDDNDIAVTKPNYQGTIHFSDNDKGSNYGSSCAYGNCGSNNVKPSYSQNTAPVPENTKCNSPGCNNYGPSSTAISNAAATAYSKPATQLVAPKEDTTCTTPNCQTGPVNMKPYSGYSPNYNTPSPIATPDRNPSQCAGNTCQYSQTKTPYSTNYVNPAPTPTANGCNSPNCGNNSPIKPSSNCAGGSCGYNPSSDINKEFDRQPGYSTKYPQGATYNTPVPSGSGCSPGSPNCSPVNSGQYPINSGQYNPGVTPSQYYTPPVLGSPTTGSSTYNKPSFKPATIPPSGYSGSLNIPSNQPNSEYAAASAAHQSNGYRKPGNLGYGSYLNGPAFTSQGTAPAGYSSAPYSGSYNPSGLGTYPNSPAQNCNTPNCLNSGIRNVVPTSAVLGNIPKPTGGEKEKLPVYHGGFGGPTGILNPLDFHVSPSPINNPGSALVGNSDCVSGNCGQPIHSSFGGPAGLLKPNEQDVSQPTGYKPVSSPVGPVSKPDCVSGNCGQPIHDGFGGPAGILKPNEQYASQPTGYKPVSLPVEPVSKPDCGSGSCGQPIHSGFGGPAGIFKPNGHDVPQPTGYKPVLSPVGPGSKPDCESGNCGQPIPGGFGGPAGIFKPNENDVSSPTGYKPISSAVGPVGKPDCGSGNCGQPTVGSIAPSYAHSGTNPGATASASAKAIAYTGGFGGPPGILSPYDGGKINLPIGSKQFSQNALTQDTGNSNLNAGNGNSNANNGNGSYGHSGAQAQSIAQANAVSGGSFGVNPHNSGHKSGCDGSCSGGSPGTNYGSNGGYGLAKSGTADGVHGGLNIASASAKSIADAGPSVHGGYASSSASASSGIKSSYGKR